MKVLSTGARVYTREELKKEWNNLQPKKYSVEDQILMLLYAHKDVPIQGRIKYVKELFLFNECLKRSEIKDEIADPHFVPYTYGPYSFDVAELTDVLVRSNMILKKGRKGSKTETFELTEHGIKTIKEKFETLPDCLKKEIRESRHRLDQLTTDGILRLIYLDPKYEHYKDRSAIKSKYKDITWGRGRG